MHGSRLRFVAATSVLVSILFAACGGDDPTDAGTPDGSTGPASAGSEGQAGDGVSTTDVKGLGTVLVDADGFTLYYLETDAHSEVTCIGECAQNWPPVPAAEMPDASDLPGKFGTIAGPSGGDQLTYESWPLYTFVGDSEPGQAEGQGVAGVWFAMTPGGPGGGGDSPASRY